MVVVEDRVRVVDEVRFGAITGVVIRFWFGVGFWFQDSR